MLRDILIVALVPSVRTAFSPAITIGKIVRSFIMPARRSGRRPPQARIISLSKRASTMAAWASTPWREEP